MPLTQVTTPPRPVRGTLNLLPLDTTSIVVAPMPLPPPALPIRVVLNQSSHDQLSVILDKIRAFNAIILPVNYPVAKYVYKIQPQELTSAEHYLLAGEIDRAKTEYARSTSLTPHVQLNSLRYAALSGKPNALTNVVTLFQINIAKITLIDLFTILHYAALGGNVRVVEQAIEWIHAHHRDRNRFTAISKLLPLSLFLSTLTWGGVVGMAFTLMNVIPSNDIMLVILMTILAAFLLAVAVAVTLVCWHTPIALLCKFPGFDAKSLQILDASAGIALIAAILSDNPQVIEAISSKMLRSSSITYPIPTNTVITYTPYGSITTKRTSDSFSPNYIDFATGKTDATQIYTRAITEYYSICCYRRHPEAPQPSNQATNEFRMFTTPRPTAAAPQREMHTSHPPQ